MSAKECRATDWRTVGYEDGVVGYSGNRIGQYRKQCGEHGISPDLNSYQLGRDEGLREYCKPLNGFRAGARGNGYKGVCPAELDAAFMDAYQSGRHLHTLRSRVGSTVNEIDSLREEADLIDRDLISVGAQILDRSIAQEVRAQLLVDSKRMAERKGEIKARIPRLEDDLVEYRRELDDYRETLPYVE
ncbi:MAG: DUF2799 domain-containing protein [Steroidobacteraceae bacterium]